MTTRTTRPAARPEPCPVQVQHLALSVLSDGGSYSPRVGAALKALESAGGATRFRAIVEDAARALHRQFGTRVAPYAATVKAAAASVEEYMIDHLFDSARAGYTGERCRLFVRRWVDRNAGTGYVSGQLRIPVRPGSMPCGSCGDGELWIGIPLTAGDTGAAESAARRTLARVGIAYPHLSFDVVNRGFGTLAEQFNGLARLSV